MRKPIVLTSLFSFLTILFLTHCSEKQDFFLPEETCETGSSENCDNVDDGVIDGDENPDDDGTTPGGSTTEDPVDNDGDGFTVEEGDCNDQSNAHNPDSQWLEFGTQDFNCDTNISTKIFVDLSLSGVDYSADSADGSIRNPYNLLSTAIESAQSLPDSSITIYVFKDVAAVNIENNVTIDASKPLKILGGLVCQDEFEETFNNSKDCRSEIRFIASEKTIINLDDANPALENLFKFEGEDNQSELNGFHIQAAVMNDSLDSIVKVENASPTIKNLSIDLTRPAVKAYGNSFKAIHIYESGRLAQNLAPVFENLVIEVQAKHKNLGAIVAETKNEDSSIKMTLSQNTIKLSGYVSGETNGIKLRRRALTDSRSKSRHSINNSRIEIRVRHHSDSKINGILLENDSASLGHNYIIVETGKSVGGDFKAIAIDFAEKANSSTIFQNLIHLNNVASGTSSNQANTAYGVHANNTSVFVDQNTIVMGKAGFSRTDGTSSTDTTGIPSNVALCFDFHDPFEGDETITRPVEPSIMEAELRNYTITARGNLLLNQHASPDTIIGTNPMGIYLKSYLHEKVTITHNLFHSNYQVAIDYRATLRGETSARIRLSGRTMAPGDHSIFYCSRDSVEWCDATNIYENNESEEHLLGVNPTTFRPEANYLGKNNGWGDFLEQGYLKSRTTDLAGNPRLITFIDIGAYELQEQVETE